MDAQNKFAFAELFGGILVGAAIVASLFLLFSHKQLTQQVMVGAANTYAIPQEAFVGLSVNAPLATTTITNTDPNGTQRIINSVILYASTSAAIAFPVQTLTVASATSSCLLSANTTVIGTISVSSSQIGYMNTSTFPAITNRQWPGGTLICVYPSGAVTTTDGFLGVNYSNE